MHHRMQNIDGNVVYRGHSTEYKEASAQYASCLNIRSCLFAPAFIVQALHDTDVINTIRYAKRHHLAFAIRTGGHHYIGMSSTGKQNIQLDVSLAYKTIDISRLETKRLVKCGILPLPNEDFGWRKLQLNQPFRMRFRSTFQGC